MPLYVHCIRVCLPEPYSRGGGGRKGVCVPYPFQTYGKENKERIKMTNKNREEKGKRGKNKQPPPPKKNLIT